MMKRFLLLLLPISILANVHYARVEPFDRATIKASVGGIITKVNISSEGRTADAGVIIQIDDSLDRQNLKDSKESIKLIKQMSQINTEILDGLKKSVKLKQSFFDKIKSLSSSTQSQKDNANMALIAAKNQMLGTKEKVATLKKQIIDMQYKISMLKESIAKKRISLEGRYIYNIMVHAGEFAAPGMPLVIADDLSKEKLTIYLDQNEVKGLKNKKVYIDGNETSVKINKLWKEADAHFISAYKAQIILPSKYPFSSLLKIEIK